jgi:hypothetical protein
MSNANRDEYVMDSNVLYMWETRNWRYEICDNPNGPYLRETWLREGRPVHPAVDPMVSEILKLSDEIEMTKARTIPEHGRPIVPR